MQPHILLPTPPDERIDAPPRGLEWSERIRRDGGSVTFRGPRPRIRLGLGIAIVMATIGVLIALSEVLSGIGRAIAPTLVILIFDAALIWKWRAGGVPAGLVDVDGARLLINPAGLFNGSKELPLARIDYVAARTEIEASDAIMYGHRAYVESYRWYIVHVYLHEGDRVSLAAFGDRECALFVAQRVDMLVERARAVAGLPARDARIDVVPYR